MVAHAPTISTLGSVFFSRTHARWNPPIHPKSYLASIAPEVARSASKRIVTGQCDRSLVRLHGASSDENLAVRCRTLAFNPLAIDIRVAVAVFAAFESVPIEDVCAASVAERIADFSVR